MSTQVIGSLAEARVKCDKEVSVRSAIQNAVNAGWIRTKAKLSPVGHAVVNPLRKWRTKPTDKRKSGGSSFGPKPWKDDIPYIIWKIKNV